LRKIKALASKETCSIAPTLTLEAVWLNLVTILGPVDGNAQLTVKSGRFLEDLLLVHG